MLERTAKDENLILYRVFGGAVIQNRIAALFFLWTEIWPVWSFSCEKVRSPPTPI